MYTLSFRKDRSKFATLNSHFCLVVPSKDHVGANRLTSYHYQGNQRYRLEEQKKLTPMILLIWDYKDSS